MSTFPLTTSLPAAFQPLNVPQFIHIAINVLESFVSEHCTVMIFFFDGLGSNSKTPNL